MKRLVLLLLCIAMLFSLPILSQASEIDNPIQIHTTEELLKIAEAPEGNYILMNDLDMTGITWPSPDFTGTFDGNGHAILNLTLSQPGPSSPESYDGNLISYETQYVGLFGTLIGAEVKNLNLLNVRGLVESDVPVFLAGIAGYFQESTISGCNVKGTLELRAHDRMFGVGGIAGFGGIGLIENCNVDVTLICTDTDAETKDEQFLGGIYGTGFVNVKDCVVTIDGYVSEHGYVHNGGIVGMFMQQPFGNKITGQLSGNKVYGKITFFENNRDRRAYCRPIAGETLAFSAFESKNKYEFKRDERKEYDVELRPEMCENPVYTEEITPSTCDTYGYTTYTCSSCGYSYTDRYTLFAHTITQWEEVQPASLDSEGVEAGNCDLCGIAEQRSIPKLESEPTVPETTASPQIEPEPVEPAPAVPKGNPVPLIIGIGAAIVILLLLLIILIRRPKPKKGRFQK